MPTRRLAAVLFADIVGYTAMMQQNETQGMAKAQTFRSQVPQLVQDHQGEVIEIRGDGALCIFNSAAEATACAQQIQVELGPVIPMRIGIHLGDVMQHSDHIMGDAVNIASRIESMGVAGAVLLSSSIRQQIKNKPEFQLVSLGKFAFKNVAEPMSLYALKNEGIVVPDKANMQGKGTVVPSTTSNQISHWLRFGIGGFVAAVIGSFLFMAYSFGLLGSFSTSSKEIVNERIAVIPFENLSQDAELDMLGIIAADWINRGLMEIGDAEVVSPATARMHQNAIGIRPNDPQGRATFTQLTGAQNVIKGNFYQEKAELVFNMEIQDAADGKLRKSFEPIRGDIQNKEALISRLREEINGYWAAREMVDKRQINPPKYKAYSLYVSSLNEWPITEESLQEIIAIDSNFYLPRINFLNINRGETYGTNYTHFEFLNRHKDQLSKYESAWLNFLNTFYKGNPSQAFNYLNAIRLNYPGDAILNQETAALALEGLDNPELALSIYAKLPTESIIPDKLGTYYVWRFRNIITCRAQLGQEREIKLELDKFNKDFSEESTILSYSSIMMAALTISDTALFEFAYEHSLSYSDKDPINYLLYFGIYFYQSSSLPHHFRVRIKEDFLRFSKNLGEQHPMYISVRNFFSMLKNKPDKVAMDLSHLSKLLQIYNLYWGGMTFIEQGETEKARFLCTKLEALLPLLKKDINVAAIWGISQAYYYLGVLYAQLGEQKIALEHLKQAKALGMPKYLFNFEYDRNLSALHHLPAFKNMIKPKWPDGNVKGKG